MVKREKPWGFFGFTLVYGRTNAFLRGLPDNPCMNIF